MATIKVESNPIQENFLARTTAPDRPKDTQAMGWAIDEYLTTGDDTKLRTLYEKIGAV